jgi:hypothetical protein
MMIKHSIWGIMLLFWSLIGLVIALYRREVVLLSWAWGTLVFLLAHLVLQLFWYRGLSDTNKKLSYHVPLPLFTNHEAVFMLKLVKPLPSFVLFSHSLRLSWHFVGFPVFDTFYPLPSAQREITLTLIPPKRGVFTIKHQLVRHDIFGIFALATQAIKGSEKLVVGLGHSHSSVEMSLVLAKVPALVKTKAVHENEFSQHRAYHPSDDPRRINWTLYARFHDLFMRVSDDNETVTKEVTIRLLPPRYQPLILDQLLKTAYFMSDFLISKKLDAVLSIDKQLEIAHFSGQDTIHRLALAPIHNRKAELTWGDWETKNEVIWLLAHDDLIEWASMVKDGHALVVMNEHGLVKCCQSNAEGLVYV